jgi:hypothetical protein
MLLHQAQTSVGSSGGAFTGFFIVEALDRAAALTFIFFADRAAQRAALVLLMSISSPADMAMP